MHFLSHKINAYTIYLLYSGISSFAMSTMFTVTMLYQIETVKLDAFQLVLVGTVLEIACFIGEVPTGALADLYSRRLSIIVGIFLTGAGFLLMGLIPNFTVILLAQVLWGIGSTFMSGAEEAWASEEIGEATNMDLGKMFMRSSQIGQIASLISIPVGFGLAVLGLNVPIVLGSCILIALGFFLWLFMPEQQFHPTPREERNSWAAIGKIMIKGGQTVRKSRKLLLILAITAFGAMASEGFDRLQTVHFDHDYIFPTTGHLPHLAWFAIISVGAAILSIAGTEVIRRYVDTSKERVMVIAMAICNVLLIASIAVFALAGNFILAVLAFWCASIFRRADQPLFTTWIVRNSDPKMRATIVSLFGQVDAIGQIVGGPGVGLIGKLVSLRAALVTTSAILAPNIFFFTRAVQISTTTSVIVEEEEDSEQVVTI